jgi:hypothetical protein
MRQREKDVQWYSGRMGSVEVDVESGQGCLQEEEASCAISDVPSSDQTSHLGRGVLQQLAIEHSS